MQSRIIDILLPAAVYMLVLGSMHPLDWLAGAAIGALAPRAFAPASLVAAAGTVRFLAGATLLAGRAAFATLGMLLGRREKLHSAFIEMQLPECPPEALEALAYGALAAPGTAVAEIDEPRRRLTLHALDASDPDAVRGAIEALYRGYGRGVPD